MPDDRPFTPMGHGKSLAEKMWDRLDSNIAAIKRLKAEGSAGSDCDYPFSAYDVSLETLKGQANEMAWVVYTFLTPYYESEKAVLKEAQKRWRISQGEIEFEPTPGYKYNPPPPGTPYRTSGLVSRETSRTRGPATIPAQTRDLVRRALIMDMPVEGLAQAYKLTLEQVESCRNP